MECSLLPSTVLGALRVSPSVIPHPTLQDRTVIILILHLRKLRPEAS